MSLSFRANHYRMAFLACGVSTNGKAKLGSDGDEPESAAAMKEKMQPQEWESVYKMSQDKNLYNNLISSLFPTIHGNDEVKRGITLMLFGGVPKTTGESTSLRGDINVCVVGDPSTAKSQFLKMVADFSPRAVYTSGKASSAAGLARRVDGPWGEIGHHLQELGLGSGGVSHHTHIDVAPKRRGLAGGLRNSTKQHQRDPSLHLVVAMDCGEETGDEVVVEVLVLGHLVHTLPLLRLHLLLHGSRRFWFISITAQFRLAIGGHATSKEGHPVVKVSHSKTFQASNTL